MFFYHARARSLFPIPVSRWDGFRLVVLLLLFLPFLYCIVSSRWRYETVQLFSVSRPYLLYPTHSLCIFTSQLYTARWQMANGCFWFFSFQDTLCFCCISIFNLLPFSVIVFLCLSLTALPPWYFVMQGMERSTPIGKAIVKSRFYNCFRHV